MYNVLDIAMYTVNYCNKYNYYISNLKLQQILYFIQASFLTIKEIECFSEEIEAWDFGPVIPQIYKRYCKYGNSNIPESDGYINTDNGVWNAYFKSFSWNVVSENDKDLINEMIEECEKYSTSKLVEIITNQKPWIVANKRICDNIIKKEELSNYFKQKFF